MDVSRIQAEFIKNGTNKPFIEVFNGHLYEELIPQSWKEDRITSIHKKESKQDCNNYWG